jgi:uncharacterized membrane protein YjjP (DUF1212 family)
MGSSDKGDATAPPELVDALEALLWLGAAMMGAGNTASGTRESMATMASKLGLDALSVSFSLDSIAATAQRSDRQETMVREIGLPGVNAWRLRELEQLVESTAPGCPPRTIKTKLAEIEALPPLFSNIQIVVAVSLASAAFAFLNGCPILEIVAAGIGGGTGQWARSYLSRRKLNQYGVAAICAIVAAGVYVLTATVASRAGFRFTGHPAGFISSVLFLVPGFPLVAALLDLLRHQTVAALSRLSYSVMLFLAATFGLSVIVGIVKVDLSLHSPLELAYPVKLLLRAVASFVGGFGFAVLFNNSIRTAFAVGILALAANELRLGLHDAGMMLAPASFFGALAAGILAPFAEGRLGVPRIAITVPTIIIMIPGVYAFEMIVFFNRGQMLDALQAMALCGFATGALAMGLAAARFFSSK